MWLPVSEEGVLLIVNAETGCIFACTEVERKEPQNYLEGKHGKLADLGSFMKNGSCTASGRRMNSVLFVFGNWFQISNARTRHFNSGLNLSTEKCPEILITELKIS